MRRVCIIRHGRTEANENHLYCGSTDVPLSVGGRRALIAKRSKLHYPEPEGFAFYTSGLLRTEETLAVIYGNVPHTALAGFAEMDFGEFEMRAYEELRNNSSYIEWIKGDNESNACPGGESGNDMVLRVLNCLTSLMKESDGDLMIVTHGGPAAAVMQSLFPSECRSRYEWQPMQGEGYEILFDGTSSVRYSNIPKEF